MPPLMLRTEALAKGFTLHLQGGLRIPVLACIELAVAAGECVALSGPSGAGKSTLLRCLYGTYRAEGGRILVRHRERDPPEYGNMQPALQMQGEALGQRLGAQHQRRHGKASFGVCRSGSVPRRPRTMGQGARSPGHRRHRRGAMRLRMSLLIRWGTRRIRVTIAIRL